MDAKTQKTQGRKPCDNEDRDWSDVATSQGTPRITGSHQKLEESLSSELPGGTNPINALILNFWPLGV